MIKHLGREDAPNELIELEAGEMVITKEEGIAIYNELKAQWINRDGAYETLRKVLSRLGELVN